MKVIELIDRLDGLNHEAEVTLSTDGVAQPLLSFEIKALYDVLEHDKEGEIIEILLKRVV